MNILAIDCYFNHNDVSNERFRSTTTFLDYEVIIWHPGFSLFSYEADRGDNGIYKGLKSLSERDSTAIQYDIVRRKNEIKEILELGRTVIVFTVPNQASYYYTGEKQFSGTGRNRVTTNIVNKVDLLSILPEKLNVTEARGSSIECRATEPFKTFFTANQKHFQYEAYFNHPVGSPLYFVKGTNKAVASYLKVGNGNLIFIPTFFDDDNEKLQKDFIDSIITLVEELKHDTGDFVQPLWSNNFLLPNEENEKKELTIVENELALILEKINVQKETISKIESYKILFTGSGRALEIQVAKVFENLGFQVEEGLPGRDDLIISYNNKVSVVEVKGVSKSAAEKHAAQLEKWVSGYFEMHEVMPKGILVVNAFKDLPLDKRIEDDFPSQMIGYSEKRDHCLISSLQLLCLYFDCLKNPSKKEEYLNELLSTTGVYDKYDWKEILSIHKSKKQKNIK
ncbi:MAG: hypothetical protein JSY10_03865 [Paenibacillus sp.]|nr:hypothetical protein [Paenibacillus sp.]